MGGLAVSPPRCVWLGPAPPVSDGPPAGGATAGDVATVVAGVVVTAVDDEVAGGLVVVGAVPLLLLHAAANGLTVSAADTPAAAHQRGPIRLSTVMSRIPSPNARAGVGYPFAAGANLGA
jgi:hypothetical protein